MPPSLHAVMSFPPIPEILCCSRHQCGGIIFRYIKSVEEAFVRGHLFVSVRFEIKRIVGAVANESIPPCKLLVFLITYTALIHSVIRSNKPDILHLHGKSADAEFLLFVCGKVRRIVKQRYHIIVHLRVKSEVNPFGGI